MSTALTILGNNRLRGVPRLIALGTFITTLNMALCLGLPDSCLAQSQFTSSSVTQKTSLPNGPVENEYRTRVTVYSPTKLADTPQSDSEESPGLTSAIEKSVDYLQKQISPPSQDDAESSAGILSNSRMKQKAIKTGATLTLVMCVFLILILLWRMRPGLTKTKNRKRRIRKNQPIPESIVSVLGQLPFVHNQQLQLLRLGSRLLLVSVSTNGSHTLGEIDDPVEVREIEHAFETGQFEELAAYFHNLDRNTNSGTSIRRPTGLSLGSRQTQGHYSASSGRTLLEA